MVIRSFDIQFECGVENALLSVDEISRCVYVAAFSSPVACMKDRVLELQDQIKDATRFDNKEDL